MIATDICGQCETLHILVVPNGLDCVSVHDVCMLLHKDYNIVALPQACPHLD